MLLRASHKIIAVRAFLDTRMGVEPIVTGIFSPHSTAELRGIYTRRNFVDSVQTVVLAHSFVIELLYAPLPLAGCWPPIAPNARPHATKNRGIYSRCVLTPCEVQSRISAGPFLHCCSHLNLLQDTSKEHYSPKTFCLISKLQYLF